MNMKIIGSSELTMNMKIIHKPGLGLIKRDPAYRRDMLYIKRIRRGKIVKI